MEIFPLIVNVRFTHHQKDKMDNPKHDLSPGDWITFGAHDAVVCQVFNDPQSKYDLEIVFLIKQDEAANINVKWENGEWKNMSPDSGYADNYDRLREYVSKLRRGRFFLDQ